MRYEFPLIEEDQTMYIVSGDAVNMDDLLDIRPGRVLACRPEEISIVTNHRVWWEPIEDEI
jgi:hypothetical protein